jgi:hypothetical protein
MLHEDAIVLQFHSFSDVLKAMSFVEAWDWLCKAVREPPNARSRISTASYKFHPEVFEAPSDVFVLETIAQQPSNPKALHRVSTHLGVHYLEASGESFGCWQKLFDSYTLVVSRLRPRPRFRRGLELSFELMISLAAAEYRLIVDGGLVFIGYHAVLFPTAVGFELGSIPCPHGIEWLH